jgi:DNA-binding NarL/FixJ family response regulator
VSTDEQLPAPAISVVIVDDDPLVRTGLSLILGGDRRITVIGQAADGEEALTLVPRLAPDVVLMDIRMPRLDGIAATERLMAAPRPPRVLVLTTFDADEMVLRALQAGAAGFLLKDTPPGELIEAVRTVADGHPSLSPSVTAQLISAVTEAAPSTADDPAAARARELMGTLTRA